jgi:hypothetical protein
MVAPKFCDGMAVCYVSSRSGRVQRTDNRPDNRSADLARGGRDAEIPLALCEPSLLTGDRRQGKSRSSLSQFPQSATGGGATRKGAPAHDAGGKPQQASLDLVSKLPLHGIAVGTPHVAFPVAKRVRAARYTAVWAVGAPTGHVP